MLRFVQHHTNITCDHCGTASKRSLCNSTTNLGSYASLEIYAPARAGLASIELPGWMRRAYSTGQYSKMQRKEQQNNFSGGCGKIRKVAV
jgi:hypothetical protein